MNSINITSANNNLQKLVSDVNVGFNPIKIVNNNGKNAVLVSENEWNNMMETLYLLGIPGYADEINKINNEQNWMIAEEYNPYEEWK